MEDLAPVVLSLMACMKSYGDLGLLETQGSKVPNYRVFRVSILGIVIMVLGGYPLVEHSHSYAQRVQGLKQ